MRISNTNIFLTVMILCAVAAHSQKSISMRSSAAEVFLNDTFELEIILENFESPGSVRFPEFDDLDQIGEPSRSSRTSIINGQMSKSVSYTFVLAPVTSGNINIEPAVISENGRKYRSKPLKLTVHEHKSNAQTETRDMFIVSDITSQDAYVGEILNLEYTLYIKPGIDLKLPSISQDPKFTGFVKERLSIPESELRKLTQTVYKGAKYNTLPLAEYKLKPSSSGTVTVDPIVVNVPVTVRSKRRNSFFNDPFFDDDLFSNFRNDVQKIVRSEKININIKPLPNINRPEDFAGAVGSFSIKSNIDRDTVAVGDPVNLKVIITGKGNLDDISDLNINFPQDLEVYSPERTVRINKDNSGSGSVIFQYLLLPRNSGEHSISKIKLSFFDPYSEKYKTVSVDGHDIFVKTGKGVAPASNSELKRSFRRNIEVLDSDIRYIKKDPGSIYSISDQQFKTSRFLTYLLSSLALIFTSLTIKTYIAKNAGDKALMRKKKAVKNAKKRLKNCYIAKKEGDSKEFYKQLNEAVLKFIADKFNISHAGLITEKIIEDLKKNSVEYDIITDIQDILERSSSILFAGVDPDKSLMTVDLKKAEKLMSQLNERLK
ncbi:MAG: BatD family protein [Candidatus Delongbacteria bacterium]